MTTLPKHHPAQRPETSLSLDALRSVLTAAGAPPDPQDPSTPSRGGFIHPAPLVLGGQPAVWEVPLDLGAHVVLHRDRLGCHPRSSHHPGHPSPPCSPHPHRMAKLSQHRDEVQQLLVLRVPPPPRHQDPVGSLGREGECQLWRSHGASGVLVHMYPPESQHWRYLCGDALDGVVQGHSLGQVPAQARQVLPVASAGTETVLLGQAVPGGGQSPWGPTPAIQEAPGRGHQGHIT